MEKVIKVVVGLYGTNCYLLKENKEVIIIDPGKEANKIISNISKDEKVVGIILTHGHFDHIDAVDDLVDYYKCDVYMNFKDKEMLNHKLNSAYGYFGKVKSEVKPLKENDFVLGSFKLEIISTPGHSDGSILIKYKNHLFTGDTLFKNSIGRTDLITGNNKKMYQSINLIKTLDPNLKVYPGHGEITTLKEELRYNPFYR
ncbi:MAG: MBL fold metallo-hydrolase [Erysipelotrichaceae bacterium]|jgi:glyoxylase-like metal-dependent hydrolase (beta-lactamase superfamily II)|nr:MBL fold metallo-hydrolase [Bacillota bacterium]NLP21880.1 MBL fold metallo-hydrolase [Erysipelotrichaceae bacterium]